MNLETSQTMIFKNAFWIFKTFQKIYVSKLLEKYRKKFGILAKT